MTKKVSIPKTKEECFSILDEKLSNEEKETIAFRGEEIDLHFGLGLWIRNSWIYPQSDEEIKRLLKTFDDRIEDDNFFLVHPDDYSEIILDAYQEYLKQKLDK